MLITLAAVFSLIWGLLLSNNSNKSSALESDPKKMLRLQINNYYSAEVQKKFRGRKPLPKEHPSLTPKDYETQLSNEWLGRSFGDYLKTKKEIFEVSPNGLVLRILDRSIDSDQESAPAYVWLVRSITDTKIGPTNPQVDINIFDIKLQDANIFWFTLLWSDTNGLVGNDHPPLIDSLEGNQS